MNKDRLLEIIDKFAGKKILVIGDAFVDHYIHGVVERLNPEAPVPILNVRKETDASGGAGNTAKNAAMLGARTVLVAVVGNDAAASRLEDIGRREGYEPRFIKDASRPTIRKIRHLVGSQQLLRVDFEETHNIETATAEELITVVHEEVSKGVEAIIVSDYAKGVITETVAAAILKVAKQNKTLVMADIKPSRAAYFKHANIISPNLKEGHEFLGLNPLEHGSKTAEQIAPLLREKMDTDVYLTLGAGGMYVCSKDGTNEQVSQEHVAEVFDVSGAGDTAAVALTLARLSGATPVEAARIANAAGAVVVGKVGSVGLTCDELKNMLSHRHE